MIPYSSNLNCIVFFQQFGWALGPAHFRDCTSTVLHCTVQEFVFNSSIIEYKCFLVIGTLRVRSAKKRLLHVRRIAYDAALQ